MLRYKREYPHRKNEARNILQKEIMVADEAKLLATIGDALIDSNPRNNKGIILG